MSNERDDLHTESDDDFVLADENADDLVESEDDFELAEEPTPKTDRLHGMRQSDQGLRFEPSETGGGYELQSADGSWSGESNATAFQTGAASSANSVEPPKSEDGIYGLQTPSFAEQVAPSSRAQGGPTAAKHAKGTPKKGKSKDKEKGKGKSKSSARSREDEGFSLDALYARRFAKRAQEDDETPRAERPQLPDRPLARRFLAPFLTYGFALRFGVVALITAFVMTPCLYVFARVLSSAVSDVLEKEPNIGAFFAFFSCAWNNKFLLLLFSMLWTALATPHYFQLWLETASGSDDVDDWGGYDFVTSAGGFLWLLCIVALAGIPGAALFGLVGFSSWVGLVLSSAILSPFCLLSCLQSGGYFTIFSKEVALSVKKRSRLWLCLTSATFGVFFGLLALGTAALRRSIVVEKDASVSWLTAFFAAIVFAIVSNLAAALYLRLLGRVAWVVDEDARERREAAAEEAERDEEEKFNEYKESVAADAAARNA